VCRDGSLPRDSGRPVIAMSLITSSSRADKSPILSGSAGTGVFSSFSFLRRPRAQYRHEHSHKIHVSVRAVRGYFKRELR
jgi:hypothetical protein